jgi:hypothetical protein
MHDDVVAERPNSVSPTPTQLVPTGVAGDTASVATPPKVFSRAEYRYPVLGDGKPAGGETVTLLTLGGMSVGGCWQDDGRYIAWAPLPTRDRMKEQLLRDMVERT